MSQPILLSASSIIASFGAEKFHRIAALAKEKAAQTGVQMPPSDPELWEDLHSLGQTIYDHTEESAWPRVLMEVYVQAPAYGLLRHVDDVYDTVDEQTLLLLLESFGQMIDDYSLAESRALVYLLWQEIFRHPARVDQAWETLVESIDPTLPQYAKRIEALLNIAGPVPYELKASLYAKLEGKYRWYKPILKSLYFSLYEDEGKIDLKHAKDVFNNIRVPATAEYYPDVAEGLGIKV